MSNNNASKQTIEETKRLYASLLSESILNSLQLSRPTFKVIQELIKGLITEARILRDVFTPADFDPKRRSWDRTSRIDFVQRLIDFVGRQPNQNQPLVGLVAAKLATGLDPTKTHQLLQALARIAIQKMQPAPNDERRTRTFTRPLEAAPQAGLVAPAPPHPPVAITSSAASRDRQDLAHGKDLTPVESMDRLQSSPPSRRASSLADEPAADIAKSSQLSRASMRKLRSTLIGELAKLDELLKSTVQIAMTSS